MISLGAFLAGVLLFNVPFGYWRGNTSKFTKGWFLAIHVPVFFVFAARQLAGFDSSVLPFSIAAFFTGQLLGGRIHSAIAERCEASSNLFADLLKLA